MTGLVDKIKGAVSREPSRDRGAGASPSPPLLSHARSELIAAFGLFRRAGEERGRAAHHGHGQDSANGEYKIATGRGGAGNMLRSKSPPGSRDRAKHGGGVVTVEEERAASRERARSRERPHAAGRGGAGNIRSPSRCVPTSSLHSSSPSNPFVRRDADSSLLARARSDPAHEAQVKALDKEEHQIEAKHDKEVKDHPAPQPVGRGGAGNVRPLFLTLLSFLCRMGG